MRYVYECDDAYCGQQITLDRAIERRNDPVNPCPKCGSQMVRIFTRPYIATETGRDDKHQAWDADNKRAIRKADERRKEREKAYEADYNRPMPSLT